MALPISGTRAMVAPVGEHAVLSAVMEACPTGVLVVEYDGRLVQANPSARALLGLDANRLLVAYSTDYLQLGPRLRQLRASVQGSLQLVQRVVRPDGQPLWIEFHLEDLPGCSADRPLAAVYLSDRTRGLLYERTVRAQVAGLDLALSEASVAVVITDGRCRVVRWSPGAELLFGTNDRNAEGRVLGELIDVAEADVLPLLRRAATGEVIRGAPLVQRTGGWGAERVDGATLADEDLAIDLREAAAVDRAHRHLSVSVAVAATDEFGTTADRTFDAARYAWVLLPADHAQAGVTLRTSERRLRKILQNINDTVVIVDEEGNAIASSGQFSTEPVLGFSPEVWDRGLNMFDLIHPDDQAWVAEALMELLDRPGERRGGRLRVRTADGSYVDAEGWAVNLLDDPDVNGILVTTRNVTDRIRDEAFLTGQAEVLRQIASSAPLELTMRRLAELVNGQLDGSSTAVLHAPAGEASRAVGLPVVPAGLAEEVAAVRTHPSGAPAFVDEATLAGLPALHAVLRATGRKRAVVLPITAAAGPAGGGHPGRLGSLVCLLDGAHEPTSRDLEVLGSAADLAAIAFERDQSERDLAHQALHDELTGLANRHLLLDRLEQAHNRAQRRGRRIALMFLDLDRFKNINDSLGHDVGDELLRQFAERLRLLVRPEDTVARFGGDEFVVLVEAVIDEQDITQIADRLEGAMSEPFLLDGQQLTVTVSVGIVMANGEEDPATLLRNADTAMYRAKELGRNRTEIYDQRLEAHLADRTQLSLDLSSALAKGHLRLAYQPVIDLDRGQVAMLEAQVRWDHPQHGRLLPLDFLAVAEDAGHGLELGTWVIERGLSDLAGFARDPAWVGVPGWARPPKLAVQLSARQLAHPEMVLRLEQSLQRHRFLAANLAIDIPERVLSTAGEHVLRNLDALRELGVTISVDDVGAAHSSALLSAVRRVPVDLIKIDASVVAGLRTVRGDSSQVPQHSLAAGLIGLGHGLGLTVLAKGVDSALWLQQLRHLGCDLAQGAVLGAPVDAERLVSLLPRSA